MFVASFSDGKIINRLFSAHPHPPETILYNISPPIFYIPPFTSAASSHQLQQEYVPTRKTRER